MGFNPLQGDLNDDGIVDATDGVLLRAKIGAKLGDEGVDPRMDFDGDGVISVNDYEMWCIAFGDFERGKL